MTWFLYASLIAETNKADLMNPRPTAHRVCMSGTPGSVHGAAHEATADHARFALGFKFSSWLCFFHICWLESIVCGPNFGDTFTFGD